MRQYLIAQLTAWCTQFFSFGEGFEFRQHCLNLLFSIIKQTWLVHNRTWQCMCQSIGWCSIVCCISFSKLCFLIVFWQRSYKNITFVHFSFRLASLALQTENIRCRKSCKGGSDLVWYSIDRDIFIQNWVRFFVEKKIKTSAEGIVTKKLRSINFTIDTFEIDFKSI